jgi:N6-L-threonylcarbamoyladenine synthase
MITLGIETSCDETAVGIVENGTKVLANTIYSQVLKHQKYGGVIPEMASRLHVANINKTVKEALNQAKCTWSDIDIIGSTRGPGLLGAVSTGLIAAKALAYSLSKPFVGVHHIEGHILANFLDTKDSFQFPCLALVVSGGHTQLLLISDWFKYTLLSNTLDDAVGEAFDKSARVLGLGYPGGPIIDKLAKEGDPSAFKFPRVKTENPLDFSFSGLKTSVIQLIQKHNLSDEPPDSQTMKDFCASFQEKCVQELITKTEKAARENNVKQIIIAGGVSANSGLRTELKNLSKDYNIVVPELKYCTDNGAMIAAAVYFRHQAEGASSFDIKPTPNLKLAT